jgi:hypothetical protein
MAVIQIYTVFYSDGIRAGRPGIDSQQGGNFSLLYSVQIDPGASPVSYEMGTGDDSPRVKRPGREADHSPPSSAPYVFMAQCFII